MRLTLLLASLNLLLVSGCATRQKRDADESAPPRSSPLVAGYSVEKRPIEAHLLGEGRRAVLMLASMHGDEPAGTRLAHSLIDHVLGRLDVLKGMTLVVLPVANPDGYRIGSRKNANGVDLNRNFPSRNWEPAPGTHGEGAYGVAALSEPEARVIEKLIRAYHPERILTIHQPLRCVDYDGPAEDLAERVSAASGLPIRKLGTRPGSLGAYAGEDHGIAVITLELPPDASHASADELWKQYGEAVRIALLVR